MFNYETHSVPEDSQCNEMLEILRNYEILYLGTSLLSFEWVLLIKLQCSDTSGEDLRKLNMWYLVENLLK